jgi:L-fuculose-phosphate aldolase
MPSRAELAAQIVAASHALHARGWVANHDGNVSARLPGGRFLVTPTAISKADATEGGLAVTDDAGTPVEGDTRPPSEFALHLGAYAERPDVHAVVHAHPPYATALACAGKAIEVFLPEAVVSIGATVPITTFALPFGAEGAAPIRQLIPRHDALLLCRHGVITVGPTLELAMLRMELVEHLARIATLALPHGGVQPLPEGVLEPLLAKRRKAGKLLGAAAANDFGPGGRPPASAPAPAPTPAPAPNAWTPAGPPPAPDAWSGGRTEGACSKVYGAPEQPVQRPAAPADLSETVAAELRKVLGHS